MRVSGIHGYPRVLKIFAGFFKADTQRVNGRVAGGFFLAGRVAGRRYPCPTQHVVIPNNNIPIAQKKALQPHQPHLSPNTKDHHKGR